MFPLYYFFFALFCTCILLLEYKCDQYFTIVYCKITIFAEGTNTKTSARESLPFAIGTDRGASIIPYSVCVIIGPVTVAIHGLGGVVCPFPHVSGAIITCLGTACTAVTGCGWLSAQAYPNSAIFMCIVIMFSFQLHIRSA